MKKRILHLIATNFLGGPEKQIVEHLKRIDNSKFEPIAVSFLENNMPNEFLEQAFRQQISCWGIPMANPIDFRALYNLNQFVREKKIDLLCVHGYKSCVMGWLVAKKNRIPIIAFSRGYTAENIKILFYQWLERQFLGHMDGVITVSRGQLNKLQNKYKVKSKGMQVVYNAISINTENGGRKSGEKKDAVLNSLGLPSGAKIVVAAGRLSPEKGHRYLIEAIGLLKELKNNFYFVLCGDGQCKSDLMKIASSHGLSQNVIFAGFRRDMPDIYESMEFMVLPSLTEGLPNVILEAFAAKKTVVATRVGGVPEIVDDGVNGFLCSAGSPNSLAKAIDRAFSENERLQEMGMAGFEKVRNDFSAKAQNQQLESIYNRMLAAEK